MLVNSPDTDFQNRGDTGVVFTFDDPMQHLSLPRRQTNSLQVPGFRHDLSRGHLQAFEPLQVPIGHRHLRRDQIQ